MSKLQHDITTRSVPRHRIKHIGLFRTGYRRSVPPIIPSAQQSRIEPGRPSGKRSFKIQYCETYHEESTLDRTHLPRMRRCSRATTPLRRNSTPPVHPPVNTIAGTSIKCARVRSGGIPVGIRQSSLLIREKMSSKWAASA